MSEFLSKISRFITPLFILFIVLEVVIRLVPNEYSVKHSAFQSRISNIEVLILGSSHSLRGINPHKFDSLNAFSIAMLSQDLDIDYRIYFKNIDKLQSLSTVIIPISYFSLFENDDEGELVNRVLFYNIFYDLKINQPYLSMKTWSLASSYGFRNSVFRVYKSYWTNYVPYTDSLGWMGEGGRINRTEDEFNWNAQLASERHESGSKNLNVTSASKQLVEVISDAESKGISVILITTPKTRFYLNKLDENKIMKIDSTMNQIELNYSNVQYLNFRNSNEFDITDFRNSDHLNELGANKLSKMIIDRMD